MAGSSVLVVEDDEAIRELLVEILLDEDYTVTAAADGASALALVSASPVHLVLLDTYMPIMDGAEFLQEFRQLTGPYTPVIGLSADSATLAADTMLAKPFELETLSAAVRGYLRPKV